MNNQYVTKLENGAYRVARTRVSLDSVVYAYWRGESPEGIVDSFPALTLEQVYGAIAFYLGRQAEIDSYLEGGDAEFEKLREPAPQANPLLYKKLEEARPLSILKAYRYLVPISAGPLCRGRLACIWLDPTIVGLLTVI